MSERFTAPVAGWYHFATGQEPRLVTDEEAAVIRERDGITMVVRMLSGDVVMDSGAVLPGERPETTIPWNG